MRARSGSLAVYLRALAMLVAPAGRWRLMARFRIAAITAGPVPVRMRERSSSKVTSRTQWSLLYESVGGAVSAFRLVTLVRAHPAARLQQERWIGHKVEQIIEHATRVGSGPFVQLGLNTQYPRSRRIRDVLWNTGVHPRISWHVLSFVCVDSLRSFPMWTALPSSEYYARGIPELGQDLDPGVGSVVGDRIYRFRAGSDCGDRESEDHGQPMSFTSGFAGIGDMGEKLGQLGGA